MIGHHLLQYRNIASPPINRSTYSDSRQRTHSFQAIISFRKIPWQNDSSCTTAKADPHGGFMRLPFEIRSRIYHYLFNGLRLARVSNHGRKPIQPPAAPSGYPPILLSNRATRDEALSVYYELVDFSGCSGIRLQVHHTSVR